jgi:hypothetical protein
MDNNETFHVCEACRERVDPADPDVVRAVELVGYPAMGRIHMAERFAVFFHRSCFPRGEAYRLLDDPAEPD